MLTLDGRRRMLELTAAELEGGSIVVGNGNGQSASAPIESAYVSVTVEDDEEPVLIASATFRETDAVFEWRERSVVTRDGVVLESEPFDGGRKTLGAVVDVEVEVGLGNARDA